MSAPVLTIAWIIPASIMRTMTVAIFATVIAPEKVATMRQSGSLRHRGEHVGRLAERAAAEGGPATWRGASSSKEWICERIERRERLEVVLAAVGEAAHGAGGRFVGVPVGHVRRYSPFSARKSGSAVALAFAALLAAVRKSLPARPLVAGRQARARGGGLRRRGARGDALVARVRAAGPAVAPTVTLYPDDGEWSCDCGAPVDPCAHVAAAVIAASQRAGGSRRRQGAARPARPPPRRRGAPPLPASDRKGGALSLERFVVRPDGGEEPLRVSLASPGARSGSAGGALSPTHEDLAVDRIVGARQPGWFPADRVADIFGALSTRRTCASTTSSCSTSARGASCRARWCAIRTTAWSLVIDRDPRITAVVAAGIVRCGDTLHPLGETDLTGPRLEQLPLRGASRRRSSGSS